MLHQPQAFPGYAPQARCCHADSALLTLSEFHDGRLMGIFVLVMSFGAFALSPGRLAARAERAILVGLCCLPLHMRLGRLPMGPCAPGATHAMRHARTTRRARRDARDAPRATRATPKPARGVRSHARATERARARTVLVLQVCGRRLWHLGVA